ncbi:hypothetical protein FRC03_006325 [Tulasnella sp. 419]|nr:hypothetical protein FRC03_006325 [Tulasnella sp. 419]
MSQPNSTDPRPAHRRAPQSYAPPQPAHHRGNVAPSNKPAFTAAALNPPSKTSSLSSSSRPYSSTPPVSAISLRTTDSQTALIPTTKIFAKSGSKISSLTPPKSPFGLGSRFSFLSTKTTPGYSSSTGSFSEKYSLSADPSLWSQYPNTPEADDYLHNPDPRRDRMNDRGGSIWTSRGIANLGCMFILVIGLVGLFAAYPILTEYMRDDLPTFGGFNLGGINATGQVPALTGNFGLIDRDTPESAYEKPSYTGDGRTMKLVFSDEFNVDGRTFYPGDDPYWEAEDLHYWGTNNLEWYDPAAITTKDGNLVITLSEKPTHDLDYEGGLLSSWNKFCFTGGIIEVSAVLPGASDVYGLWPAVWTMGNLGRMGYGASLEGMWPYTYDACDVGTLPNQTFADGTPVANTEGNDEFNGGALSFLPGQKLSACTCEGEIHPGPKKADGSFVGRGAPEIDILEATVDQRTRIGHISMSAQWAPFDYKYLFTQNADTFSIDNPDVAELNEYVGGVYQQTTSALVLTNQQCYENSGGCYSTYGFEYKPGTDGYITWISDGKASWTVKAGALGPNSISGASQRPIPQEPMYSEF